MSRDAYLILGAQGLRAFAYGFGSVLLGVSLEAQGWSAPQVGLLLTAIVAGTALMSLVVGRFGDRLGRRRFYALLFLGLAASGAVFGLSDDLWLLTAVAVLGLLSTEVVESGPFTSLEQVMLPQVVSAERRNRIFGTYNAIATVVGSVGALAAGGPALLRGVWAGAPADQGFFLVFVPIGMAGAVMARSLSGRAEEGKALQDRRAGSLRRSRSSVLALSSLFAMDSFAGGFVLQSFIVYWFRLRFGVPTEVLGLVFFAVGLLQSGSFLVAVRLADRIGLLNTMVFTHLPSNLLLAGIPLASSLPVAVVLLLGRFALSQMDVPTRQAYVVALVDPEERTAAAGYTNSARYAVRPLGPALAGAAQQVAVGLPFVLAGSIKGLYDVVLWVWFRKVPLAPEQWGLETTTSSKSIPASKAIGKKEEA
jgi:MFS family permease